MEFVADVESESAESSESSSVDSVRSELDENENEKNANSEVVTLAPVPISVVSVRVDIPADVRHVIAQYIMLLTLEQRGLSIESVYG
jgi:hypothetical protein